VAVMISSNRDITPNIGGLINTVISVLSSIASYATSTLLHYPIPVGLIVTISFFFYKRFSENPFKTSTEALKKSIIDARVEEERITKELRELKRILSKVKSKEIEGDELLLNMRIKQLEEDLELIRSKVRLTSMIIMIRENIGIFQRFFGRDDFEKLTNVEELSKYIDKELEKTGMKEVDVGALYEYFNELFPVIIKDLKKFEVKTQPPPQQPPSPPPQPSVDLEGLLEYGSVNEWLDVVKKAVENGWKLKLPPKRRYYEKDGFRNLLIAIYTIDTHPQKLKEVLVDRFLVRSVEYLKELSRGRTVEVNPDSSDKEYIDDILRIVCGEPLREEVTEEEITKYYKISIHDKEIIIERKTIKDPSTKKAQRILYKATT
jgi:hypothetical protein